MLTSRNKQGEYLMPELVPDTLIQTFGAIAMAVIVVMFGIQISKFVDIIDFSCANDICKELISKNWTWEELDSKYRGLRNSLLSEFRIASPK